MCGVDERIFQSEKEVTAGQTAEGSMRGGSRDREKPCEEKQGQRDRHARGSGDRETGMRGEAETERSHSRGEQRQRDRQKNI